MSENQYYEFAAIDRPLTAAEIERLRSVSTRARISATSFTNHYQWGGLKADPTDWMRRYFDAYVFSADWGSCLLALRVPLATFDKSELKPFTAGGAVSVEATDKHWIIYWELLENEDYDRYASDDGSGWMSRLIPLRDELQRGDLRPLYLGWLAAASGLDGSALEPELPAGMAELTPAQQALTEFLEVDLDLLEAAASASPPLAQSDSADDGTADKWLDEWSRDEMAAMLKLIAHGQGREAERQIKSRLAVWLKAQRPHNATSVPRRNLAMLRELSVGAAKVRQAREAKAREELEAKRRAEREVILRRLMVEVESRWAGVDAQMARGTASGYEEAVRAVKDLSDAYTLTSSQKEFDRALRRLLVRHATRAALMKRLTKAGLWSG